MSQRLEATTQEYLLDPVGCPCSKVRGRRAEKCVARSSMKCMHIPPQLLSTEGKLILSSMLYGEGFSIHR